MSRELNSKSVFSSALFFAAASMIARAGGFVVQIVLGWILTKDSYGLFAIALSISAVASCVINGGTDQLLIQRGKEYDYLAPRIASFSVLFNFVACVVLFVSSKHVAIYYEEPMLEALLKVISIGFLLATPGPILIAQLSIQGKFLEIAKINLITVLTKHGATILLAILGAGVFSLVVPLAMQPLLLAITCFFFVRAWPKYSNVKSIQIKDILGSSKWVIASNFAFQLTQNIQYFILGVYFNTSIIGLYFFAVQLANSPIALIDNTVKGVIFPSLSNIADDTKKYQLAILKSIVVAYSIGAIISLLGFIFLPPLTEFIWQGKWNQSLIFIEIMCLMIPVMILRNAIYEILASAGLWRLRFMLLLVAITFEVVAILLVVTRNDMYLVVMSLLIFRHLFVIIFCYFVVRRLCVTIYQKELFALFVPNVIIAAIIVTIRLWGDRGYEEVLSLVACLAGLIYYLLLLNKYIPVSALFKKFNK